MKGERRDATINVRVPADLKDRLTQHAAGQGKTLSDFICHALVALDNILTNQQKGKK